MNKTKVQRNYKDTIFRVLFKDRENLLSPYNALNKTNYIFRPCWIKGTNKVRTV